jgi:nucleotide-binding universal stress UspA family protein
MKMPGINGIICPVDFSERSLEALDTAFDLSEEFSANLYVMHVIKDFARDAAAVHAGVGFGIDAFRDQLHADAMERIDLVIESRTPVRTGVLGVVTHGDPALEIVNEAKARDADLIVLSSRGASMLGRLVLGSVAAKVLELSRCPVLVIPSTN